MSERIVVHDDYHHGSENDAWVWLSPGLRACLAHKIGNRKTVVKDALLKARKELELAIEELDDLIEKEVDKC